MKRSEPRTLILRIGARLDEPGGQLEVAEKLLPLFQMPHRIVLLSFALLLATELAGQSLREYEQRALRGIGNVENGRRLFLEHELLACSRCHALESALPKAGPSLESVGDKFGRRELVDSILAPSSSIAVGYETAVLETADGEEQTGIVKEANDKAVLLAKGDGSTASIPKNEVVQLRYSSLSLMPEGLEAAVTPSEFLDLIEFLASLKMPANAAVATLGMPAEIQKTEHSVKLSAFHEPALKFQDPVWFGEIPGCSEVYAVVEHQTGRIWRLQKGPDGIEKRLFLDLGSDVIKGGTRGLLGLVFHPAFRETRRYFIALSLFEGGSCRTRILQRTAREDLQQDAGEEPKLILEIDAATPVHYGGALEFGPDNFLYIGMGDTGPQEDPHGHAQNLSLLRGKILRIDVDHPDNGKPYALPPDNPFLGVAGARPEIWAYGFREPWRFSFDPVTEEFWTGDVGQDRYEEVDVIQRGGNYGWNVYEGFEPFSNRYRREGDKYVAPVFAYNRRYGVSVTGGFVYRGERNSPFYGAYIFGDYESRRIFALWQSRGNLQRVLQIGVAPERIVSFGRDHAGRLYVVGYEGTIFEMDFSGISPELTE